MKVHWTDNALHQLSVIFDHIALNSEVYARRMADRLTKRSRQIGNFPYSGRIVPEFKKEEVREVIEGVYRIIYCIKQDQIDILTVFHGSRQIMPEWEIKF